MRAVGVLLLLSMLVSAPGAAAAEDQRVHLPEPAGPLPTATTVLHLTDADRVDALDPDGGPRELMAQVWYPRLPVGDAPLAPYAPPKEAAALQAFYPVPPGAFEGAPTNSALDAPAIPGDFPVVLFAHGLCAGRTDTTAVNEHLASLGYVVVALGATHESNQVEFPDGRLVGTADPAFCTAAQAPDDPANAAILERLQRVRVADVRFTLDELAALDGGDVPWGLPGALDLDRVGIYGHSFGGSTAAQALADDPRLDAGIDLDGLIAGPVRHTGLAKPFLVVGSDYHHTSVKDPSWDDFLPKLTGWNRWLRFVDAGHYRFVDLGGSTDRWNLKEAMPPETWTSVFGDIDPQRSQQLLLDFTTAFFDRFLRDREAPILDGPSAAYPEVEFRATD
ncbi:alpha/beta hydrolase family protein [Actinophytocola gossypii]|uniref:Alpha/beta hydrolase n=1 Tax=Actinophytocola gossypii TaxID=2812003 RepID=A0ABT2JEK7_9PSEU|nr:hypothetical protein [Actinophytocola gossypii]MCT2586307.1 hypothetical protein [Actinophytocola gossypii]